jgi:hypothetical protein
MIMSYGTTVFCEDIRDELSGKKTYVGVFSSELIINGPLPALLPQFAFAITLLEPLSDTNTPLNIKIMVPGGNKDEVAIDIDLPVERHGQSETRELDPSAEYLGSLMTFKVSPLILTNEGYIRVRAYKDEKEIKLGSLKVRVADIASVSVTNS